VRDGQVDVTVGRAPRSPRRARARSLRERGFQTATRSWRWAGCSATAC